MNLKEEIKKTKQEVEERKNSKEFLIKNGFEKFCNGETVDEEVKELIVDELQNIINKSNFNDSILCSNIESLLFKERRANTYPYDVKFEVPLEIKVALPELKKINAMETINKVLKEYNHKISYDNTIEDIENIIILIIEQIIKDTKIIGVTKNDFSSNSELNHKIYELEDLKKEIEYMLYEIDHKNYISKLISSYRMSLPLKDQRKMYTVNWVEAVYIKNELKRRKIFFADDLHLGLSAYTLSNINRGYKYYSENEWLGKSEEIFHVSYEKVDNKIIIYKDLSEEEKNEEVLKIIKENQELYIKKVCKLEELFQSDKEKVTNLYNTSYLDTDLFKGNQLTINSFIKNLKYALENSNICLIHYRKFEKMQIAIIKNNIVGIIDIDIINRKVDLNNIYYISKDTQVNINEYEIKFIENNNVKLEVKLSSDVDQETLTKFFMTTFSEEALQIGEATYEYFMNTENYNEEELNKVTSAAQEKYKKIKINEYWLEHQEEKKELDNQLEQIEKEIAQIKEQIELEESIIQPNIEQLEFERNYLTESEDQANKLYDEIKSYQEKYNALGTLYLIQKKELKNIISKKTIEFNEMVERSREDRKIYNNYIDDQINKLRINIIPLEKELENKNKEKNNLLNELNKERD